MRQGLALRSQGTCRTSNCDAQSLPAARAAGGRSSALSRFAQLVDASGHQRAGRELADPPPPDIRLADRDSRRRSATSNRWKQDAIWLCGCIFTQGLEQGLAELEQVVQKL
jgi:hypothetical protein